MTYDELAEATGLARQTLLNLAAGRTYGDLRTWLILAKVWGVGLDVLTDGVWG
ncbi:helix-turn-helix transcriptional regulator [Micrococcus luteus]|nr:helix-turn-helix transcriptional regulator [Micrococcus luteus]